MISALPPGVSRILGVVVEQLYAHYDHRRTAILMDLRRKTGLFGLISVELGLAIQVRYSAFHGPTPDSAMS